MKNAVMFFCLFSLVQSIGASEGLANETGGIINVNCTFSGADREKRCRELGEGKLSEMNCLVNSIECRNDSSSGQMACSFTSPNCRAAGSNGFTGTLCQAGEKRRINFGRNGKLDPGFTAGLFQRPPQDICVSPKPNSPQREKSDSGKVTH